MAATPALPELIDRLAAFTPDPIGRLELDWRSYPDYLRDDTLHAIVRVLERPPAPAPDTTDENAGERSLPAGAPRLIVAQGDPRAGKDVIASYLRASYRNVAGVMTSTAIRAETNAFLAPYGHRIVEANKSQAEYRHLLQAWAMSRQQENADYWPQAAIPQVKAAWAAGAELVVITGLRWPHDAGRYRQIGGQIWRVERPGNPYTAEHHCETGFDGVPLSFFDRVVLNDVEGDLRPFEANIERARRVKPVSPNPAP